MDLRAQLLSHIASRSRARDLDLRDVGFGGAVLSGLSGDGLDFSGGDLRSAVLHRVRLGTCRMVGAVLTGSEWSGATLRTCTLDRADATQSRFDGARIEDSSARGADLTRASLRAAHLNETSFERAVLQEAVLDGCEGVGVEWRGCDMRGASLVGARLDDADFRGADLRGADFSRGRFRSADFRGALLEGMRFDGADLGGAHFDEGAAPHPSTGDETSTRSNRASARTSEAAKEDLLKSLGVLQALLGGKQGATSDLLDRVQPHLGPLGSAAEGLPQAWKLCIDSLVDSSRDDLPPELRAALAALSEEPDALRNLLGAGELSAGQFVSNLQHLVEAIDASGDQPPGAWKPWLEPLMQMKNQGQPLDPKALVEALAALARGAPPAPERRSD